MYDVIVVGARCAGASTALLLRRQGHRVLLVDRATFPSEIPHGHFIHRHGPLRLHRWGLLDKIVASGCPPVRSITNDMGDFPLTGEDLEIAGIAAGYGPRRAVLDQILVEAAVEAGVELRQGFTVEDFVTDDGRITGIRGRGRAGGATVTEHATITVGADGRNSRLARAVHAPVYEAVPPVSCYYFSYWSGVPATGLEIYVRQDRAILAFPTNDTLFAVFIAWPSAELAAVRAAAQRGHPAGLPLEPRPGAVRAAAADFARLRLALRGNQEAINQFFLANEGLIPREAFFNLENMRQVMSGGLVGARRDPSPLSQSAK